MTYELALKLKEAEFPFPEGAWFGEENNMWYTDFPSLSQLIDECGDLFTNLHYEGTGDRWDSWSATSWDYEAEKNRWTEYAPNPKEAVAKLWLALNA